MSFGTILGPPGRVSGDLSKSEISDRVWGVFERKCRCKSPLRGWFLPCLESMESGIVEGIRDRRHALTSVLCIRPEVLGKEVLGSVRRGSTRQGTARKYEAGYEACTH